jgi:hypothetical protein
MSAFVVMATPEVASRCEAKATVYPESGYSSRYSSWKDARIGV